MSGEIQNHSPWNVDAGDYPVSGTLREQLAFCVNYAVLAPSIYNTQPWLFRPLEDTLELHADHDRQLSATDPDGREMVISCGAALANLKLTLHNFGHESWVQYAPEPANPGLLARVRIGRATVPSQADQTLFRSITRRRTSRQSFQSRPIPRGIIRRLIWKAMEYGCWVYLIETSDERHHLSKLVEYAQLRMLDDSDYKAERRAWLQLQEAGVQTGSPDGSDRGTRTDGASISNGSRPVVSSQRMNSLQRDRELISDSPMIFVLGSGGDSVYEWLRTGEAMQQILLLATSEQLSASFLNQPCQIPRLRDELKLMTGRSGPPQVVLRMGYGDIPSPSPRRKTEDVILAF